MSAGPIQGMVNSVHRPMSLAASAIGLAAVFAQVGAASPVEAVQPRQTNITIDVSSCPGCRIVPVQAIKGRPQTWHGRAVKVRHGIARLRVPTRRTRGMSFEIRSRRDGNGSYNPNAVVRYAGLPVGAAVSTEAAAAGGDAYGCWAGTRAKRIRLALRVDWFPTTSITGTPAETLRAYFSPGLVEFGQAGTTWGGVLGNQQAWFC